jgi:hypothetical protein
MHYIDVRFKKPGLWDEKLIPANGVVRDLPMSKFPNGVPGHMEVLKTYEVVTPAPAAPAAPAAQPAPALDGKAEKAALLQEAKDLGIKGVHKGWPIETIRKRVEAARLSIVNGAPGDIELNDDANGDLNEENL